MNETRSSLRKVELPYSTPVERLIVRSVLFCFKDIIVVENENNLSLTNDPVIFAFNHNSYLETILIASYLLFRRDGKKISYIIDWMYGKLPFLGWLLSKADPIYVFNKNARFAIINRYKKASPKTNVYQACVDRLKNQQSIGIFPEGTRNKDPRTLKRGRLGVGAMVLATEAAVLPIGIDFPPGSGRGWLSPLGTMTLRIGSPLHFAAERAMAREITADQNLSPQIRKKWSTRLAAHITHHVMADLASLSGKHYPFPAPKALSQPCGGRDPKI